MVQVAHGRVGVLGEVLAPLAVHIERRRELEALVDLGHLVGGKVVLKAAQMQREHGRHRRERDALFGVLLAVLVRVVLIVAVEGLFLDVLVERVVQGFAPLDRHLQVVKVLIARRLVVYVDACDVFGELTAEEVCHGALN